MARQLLNPAAVSGLFRKQFELCEVKKGETIILLTDNNTPRDRVQAAFAGAADLGIDSFEICLPKAIDLTQVGNPRPGEAGGLMSALKSASLLCVFFPPNLSAWLRECQQAGVRVLSVTDTPDQLQRLQSPPGLKEAVLHAADRYSKTKTVHVTNDAGTDLTFTRGKPGDTEVRAYYGMAEKPGRFDQWGFGMIADFPDELSANGRVVVQPGDVWILPFVRMVESEIRLEIRDGFIRKVEGGADARGFREWLDRNKRSPEDMDPYAVSHLGFGLHPNAYWDRILMYGNSIEDLAVNMRSFAGNFLFSTGPGLNRRTGGHIDMPMCDCTVKLDGDTVVNRGKLVDPKMIVAPTHP